MEMTEKQQDDLCTVWNWLQWSRTDHEVLWWMARNRETQEVRGGYVTTLEEFFNTAEHFVRIKWDFYVQLNPSDRRWGTRCTADDITAWCFVPFDLDIVDKSRPADLGLATERLIDLVRSYFGFRALSPHVVFSGRGQQLWYRIPREALRRGWAVPPPLPVSVEAPRAVRLAQRYWSDYFNRRLQVDNVAIDLSCVDLPRVMRCPGTINQASGAVAAIVQTGTMNVGLPHAMLRYAPASIYAPPPEQPSALAGQPWQAYLPRLTRTAIDFLTVGATEPGRHKAVSAAVKSLLEAGCPQPEALKAVTWGGGLCRPPLGDPAYLLRTVEREYNLRSAT